MICLGIPLIITTALVVYLLTSGFVYKKYAHAIQKADKDAELARKREQGKFMLDCAALFLISDQNSDYGSRLIQAIKLNKKQNKSDPEQSFVRYVYPHTEGCGGGGGSISISVGKPITKHSKTKKRKRK